MTKASSRYLRSTATAIGLLGLAGLLASQDAPQFTTIQRLTNREVSLRLSAPTGRHYRIDASTNLAQWSSLLTLRSAAVNQYTDAVASRLDSRFYRALELPGTNILTGDHLTTDDGDLVIHPLVHASLVMSWNGRIIYNDPTDESSYQGLPKADLILVSHSHGDHFSAARIQALRDTNTIIVAPTAVYNLLSTVLRSNTIVLNNGASTNVLGLTIEAVPAYNGNHPRGTGNAFNGYVLTIGGKRIYMAGDTGDIPETRALQGIDVAFVPMNSFTMTISEATNSVRAYRPKVVYPYHFRDGSNLNNANLFRQRLGTDLDVEVRLRKWY